MSTTKCGAVPMEKGIMIRDLREEHKQWVSVRILLQIECPYSKKLRLEDSHKTNFEHTS